MYLQGRHELYGEGQDGSHQRLGGLGDEQASACGCGGPVEVRDNREANRARGDQGEGRPTGSKDSRPRKARSDKGIPWGYKSDGIV